MKLPTSIREVFLCAPPSTVLWFHFYNMRWLDLIIWRKIHYYLFIYIFSETALNTEKKCVKISVLIKCSDNDID